MTITRITAATVLALAAFAAPFAASAQEEPNAEQATVEDRPAEAAADQATVEAATAEDEAAATAGIGVNGEFLDHLGNPAALDHRGLPIPPREEECSKLDDDAADLCRALIPGHAHQRR